jgi:rhodanese-related sulfurtransferase
MKKIHIIALGSAVVLLLAFLVITSLQSRDRYRFRLSAAELHVVATDSAHYISPEKALGLLRENTGEYLFVDLRNPRQYDNGHIDGAVNLPMETVLDPAARKLLRSAPRIVLYDIGSSGANQVWMLLRQTGFENLYVLEGGLAYWQQQVMNPDIFKSAAIAADEKAKFDFKGLTQGEGAN